MHEAMSLSLSDRCLANNAFPSTIRSSMTAKVPGRMSWRSPLKDSIPDDTHITFGTAISA